MVTTNMKTTNKGTKSFLTSTGEWMQHLRPSRKRYFWHIERNAQKKLIKEAWEQ
jgi:hypothetical protein